jgi:hypothetical protein
MMKRKLLLGFAVLLGVFAYSQPTLTLRAYKQVIFPGTVPVGISENSSASTEVRKRTSTHYYLYLTYPSKEAILPQQVWINKKAYKVKVESVAKTPVEHTNRNIPARPVTTVMVPKTSQRVVRLLPEAATTSTPPAASARKLMETHELVVSFKWKGKTYYKALDQVTELEPEMME